MPLVRKTSFPPTTRLKLCLVSLRRASMVRKLADCTKEKYAGNFPKRLFHSEDFATRGMSFHLSKSAWLQYLENDGLLWGYVA